MINNTEDNFSSKLDSFIQSLIVFISNCRQTGKIDCGPYKGNIQLPPGVLVRIRVEDLVYVKNTINNLKTRKETLIGQNWLAIDYMIEDCVIHSREYSELIQYSKTVFESVNSEKILTIFIKRAIRIILQDKQDIDNRLAEIKEIYLRDLAKKPTRYGAEGFVYGISTDLDLKLKIDGTEILIRKLVKEDFEIEGNPEDCLELESEFRLIMPSAKLKIEFNASSGSEIFPQVERTIISLRLFRVGSVDYNTMRGYCNSFLDEDFVSLDEKHYTTSQTTHVSGRQAYRTVKSYYVEDQDINLIKEFLIGFFHKIPENFYNKDIKPNYLSVSYERYVFSLLDVGSNEYKIATAVMGLESLYLPENLELKYRLGTRVAKTLGTWSSENSDFAPVNIRFSIELAYDIRSSFVHGDEPNKSLVNKINKNFSSMENLLLIVLDYLRISIIVFLMLDVNNRKDFIDQIDDALIDEDCTRVLKDKLLGIQNLLSLRRPL